MTGGFTHNKTRNDLFEKYINIVESIWVNGILRLCEGFSTNLIWWNRTSLLFAATTAAWM